MAAFVYQAIGMVWKMVWGVAEGETPIPFNWYLLIGFSGMLAGAAVLANLLVTHMLFVVIDKTTIEWQETKELGHTFSYWGSLSLWYTCLQRALGKNPLVWILPTRYSIEGDGVNFHKPLFRRVPRGSKDDPNAASFNNPNGETKTDENPPLPEMVHSEV